MLGMKLTEVRKILKLAKSMGVHSFAMGDLRFEFNQTSSAQSTSQKQKVSPQGSYQVSGDQPREDELLFWSSNAFDPESERAEAAMPPRAQ